jgi:hypothetical protein
MRGWYWRNGWLLDLGYGTKQVVCKSYAGIVAREGEELRCYVVQAVSKSIYNFAKLIITNFEAILEKTWIELHIMEVGNVQDWCNQGLMYASAY